MTLANESGVKLGSLKFTHIINIWSMLEPYLIRHIWALREKIKESCLSMTNLNFTHGLIQKCLV